MQTVPDDLKKKLHAHGQEHVLAGWDRLDGAQRANLVQQLEKIDFDLLQGLFQQRDRPVAAIALEDMKPVPVIPSPSAEDAGAKSQGEAALRRGEVAIL